MKWISWIEGNVPEESIKDYRKWRREYFCEELPWLYCKCNKNPSRATWEIYIASKDHPYGKDLKKYYVPKDYKFTDKKFNEIANTSDIYEMIISFIYTG